MVSRRKLVQKKLKEQVQKKNKMSTLTWTGNGNWSLAELPWGKKPLWMKRKLRLLRLLRLDQSERKRRVK